MTGTIKPIQAGKTYGFIAREGDKDIFFHESALVGVTLAELKEGETVSFDIEPPREGAKGPSAVNVTRV